MMWAEIESRARRAVQLHKQWLHVVSRHYHSPGAPLGVRLEPDLIILHCPRDHGRVEIDVASAGVTAKRVFNEKQLARSAERLLRALERWYPRACEAIEAFSQKMARRRDRALALAHESGVLHELAGEPPGATAAHTGVAMRAEAMFERLAKLAAQLYVDDGLRIRCPPWWVYPSPGRIGVVGLDRPVRFRIIQDSSVYIVTHGLSFSELRGAPLPIVADAALLFDRIERWLQKVERA